MRYLELLRTAVVKNSAFIFAIFLVLIGGGVGVYSHHVRQERERAKGPALELLKKSGEQARMIGLARQLELALNYEANFLPTSIPQSLRGDLVERAKKQISDAFDPIVVSRNLVARLVEELTLSDIQRLLESFSSASIFEKWSTAVLAVESDPNSQQKQGEYVKWQRTQSPNPAREAALQLLDQKFSVAAQAGLYMRVTRAIVARAGGVSDVELKKTPELSDEHLARISERFRQMRLGYALRDFSQADLDTLVNVASTPSLARFYFVFGRAIEEVLLDAATHSN